MAKKRAPIDTSAWDSLRVGLKLPGLLAGEPEATVQGDTRVGEMPDAMQAPMGRVEQMRANFGDPIELRSRVARSKPGIFEDTESRANSKDSALRRQLEVLEGDKYNDLVGRVNAQKIDALREQAEGLKTQQLMAKMFAENPGQLDLTPLAALVDSQTGSKFAASYKVPTGAADKQKEVLALQNALQKNRDALSDDHVNLLKSQLGGYSQNSLEKTLLDIYQATNKPPGGQAAGGAQQNSFNREYRGKLNALQDAMKTRKEQFSNIETALAQGSYADVTRTLAQFAHGIAGEKGVLTEGDISRTIPRSFRGDLSAFESYFNDHADTDIPDEYVQSIKKLTALAKQNARKVYNDHMDYLEGVYSADPLYTGAAKGATRTAKTHVDGFAEAPKPRPTLKDEFLGAIKNGQIKPTTPAAPAPAAPAAPAPRKTMAQEFLETVQKNKAAKKGSK